MKYLLILLLSLSLCSCFTKEHVIVLNEIENLEVNNKYDACSFVKTVGDVIITSDMYQTDKIVVDEKLVIDCSSNFTPNQIGDYMITYKINNKQEVEFPVSVVDTTDPEIIVKQDSYEVEQGNVYFNINNEISFSDNYDTNLHTSIDHNINIDEIGEYKVIATAKDSSGNEVKKEIIVNVIEKEKKIETVYVTTSGASNYSNSTNSSNTSTSSGSTSSSSSSGSSNSSSSSSSQQNTTNKPTQQSSFITASSVSVPVGTSIGDVQARIVSSISSSSSYTVDFSAVNTSAPGSYPVYITGADGASTSCTVTVTE